ILILISLPTSQPPVSSAWFHVRPQFSRSIFVSAEKKARCPPKGSLICPLYSVFSVTGLVTPRIVRSPWIFQSSPPSRFTRLLVNVSSGNTSTSRKSGLRRWSSRSWVRVSMLGALMVTLMLDCVGSSAMCSAPSNSPKRPLTLATIRCRASNSTVVCAGSSTHVPALGNWTPFQVRDAPPVATACDMVSSSCRAGTASPAGLNCLSVQISCQVFTRLSPFSHTVRGRHTDGLPCGRRGRAPRRPAPVPFPPGFGHDTGMGELHFPRDEYYMRLALREAQRAAEHGDVPVGAVAA